jgi:predicted nucleic acid-binding protein
LIFVDSSVWISALRDGKSPEARGLTRLLDSDEVALSIPVYLEVLARAVTREKRYHLQRALSALPVFYPSTETWARIGKWVERAAGRGDRFGIRDLLVASIAAERSAPVWSLDVDFERMERLFQFVELFRPGTNDRT